MPLNFAIVGPGGIAGDQHAPALSLHPDAQLWSVVSRSQERATEFASTHGAHAERAALTSLADCLADSSLDALIIASPDRLHEEQAVLAAQAGKHVLLEKPMSVDTASCQRMIDAFEKAGKVLAIGYHHRHHAGHKVVRNRLSELGNLRHMRVHWTFAAPHGGNWRASPETGRWWSLAANGTHCLDLIRWMFCPTEGEIDNLCAMSSSAKFNAPHDETSIVALRFASGATAEICVSVQFASDSRVEIYGDDGYVRMEATLGRHGAGSIVFDGEKVEYQPENPFLGELDDFINAIRTGSEPEVGGVEGMRNVEILQWAARSTGVDTYS